MSRKTYANVSLEPDAVAALRRMRHMVAGSITTDVSLSQAVLVAERLMARAVAGDFTAVEDIAQRVVREPVG